MELKEAIDQLNQKVSGIDAVYAAKQKESKPCDAWLELAEALAQAERRARILDTSAGGLKASMEECLKWSSKQMDAINKFKTDLGSKFKDAINAEAAEADKLTKTMPPGSPQEFLQKRHLSCSNYCHVQGLEELDSAQWQAAKQKLADIAKLIADPIQMESFLTTSGDEYKTPGPPKTD